MFWGSSKDKKPDPTEVPRERAEPRPDDLNQPIQSKKLPQKLQSLLDKEDDDEPFLDRVYEGHTQDTTDTSVRYAAYATRVRTILLSAQRYVAYTSDIGESFRPVAHPYLVKGAYAVSWLYLLGDVGNEGRKAYMRNQRILAPQNDEFHNATSKVEEVVQEVKKGAAKAVNSVKPGTVTIPGPAGNDVTTSGTPGHIPAIEDYRAVMLQRAVFQSVASMGLPAFTIHSIVKYAGKAMKDVKNAKVRTWGPIGLGLAAVPFLPYMFDKPVEEAVEWGFHNAFLAVGGEKAVGPRHFGHGHGQEEPTVDKVKEKLKEL